MDGLRRIISVMLRGTISVLPLSTGVGPLYDAGREGRRKGSEMVLVRGAGLRIPRRKVERQSGQTVTMS